MKKYTTVILTLLLGIGLGAGCVLIAIQWMKEPPVTKNGDGTNGDGSTKQETVTIAGTKFTVTGGAAPGYIDDRACAECHRELFDSYQQVGMSHSFAAATPDNLNEDFANAKFVHQASRRHYEMARQGKNLVFRRHELDEDGKPINQFERKVDWIVGSGNHARNYLYQTDAGEMYQLPIAWYPQEQRWEMASGFASGQHAGVQKQIKRDCMFCHNAYPDVAAGSDDYASPQSFPKELPHGIGCQRCHGPGAEHARIAKDDKDAAEKFRASIVNPVNLEPKRRDDVCNQCHLQPSFTSAGLRQFGKHDYEFRPGQSLADHVIGLDVTEKDREPSERFEINHHAYRLQQSRCFTESDGQLSCTSCHDPHRRVADKDRIAHYRAACAKCHQQDACKVDPQSEHLKTIDAQDCATCHMPKRRTQDVVHVAMTDHLISGKLPETDPLAEFPEVAHILQDVILANSSADTSKGPVLRAVATLRLSSFTHPSAATQLDNMLATSDIADIEPYLDLIAAQLKQRRFAAAERTAALVLSRFPDHPLASEWRGTALFTLEKYADAAKQFQKVVESNPDRAETHYNLGLVLMNQDQVKDATTHFARAVELRPNMVLAWHHLGRAREQLDQKDEAVQAYLQALSIEPSYARSYLNLGQLYLELDRRDDTRRLWEHGIKSLAEPQPLIDAYQAAKFAVANPILSDAIDGTALPPVHPMLVAVPLPKLDDLEKPVAAQIEEFLGSFKTIVAQQSVSKSDLAEAYGMLGQLYHAYELHEAAERCYVNAIRLVPNDDRSHHLLAAIYQAVGQLDAAETHFNYAVKLNGNNVAAVVRLGLIHAQKNQPNEARERFQHALTLDKECAAAYNGLGDLALGEKKYEEAVKLFEEVLTRVPAANRVHYSLGMAYRGLEETEKATAHLEQAGTVGVRPADPLVDSLPQLLQGERVYLIRGRLALNANRFAEAAQAFRKALDAKPDSVSALVNYGAALVQLYEPEKAMEQFREALKHDPKNVTANFNLGALLTKQGEWKSASEYYRAVLEAAPSDQAAQRQLADALDHLGQLDEAIEILQKLTNDAPENEGALIELSRLLSAKGRHADAIEILESAQKKDPSRGLTAHALARLLATCPNLALRNGKRAVELAAIVVKAHTSPVYVETMALALAEAGRCDEAAALQKQLVAKAEQIQNAELAERLKKDLLRYEKGSPCRPVADVNGTITPKATN